MLREGGREGVEEIRNKEDLFVYWFVFPLKTKKKQFEFNENDGEFDEFVRLSRNKNNFDCDLNRETEKEIK